MKVKQICGIIIAIIIFILIIAGLKYFYFDSIVYDDYYVGTDQKDWTKTSSFAIWYPYRDKTSQRYSLYGQVKKLIGMISIFNYNEIRPITLYIKQNGEYYQCDKFYFIEDYNLSEGIGFNFTHKKHYSYYFYPSFKSFEKIEQNIIPSREAVLFFYEFPKKIKRDSFELIFEYETAEGVRCIFEKQLHIKGRPTNSFWPRFMH